MMEKNKRINWSEKRVLEELEILGSKLNHPIRQKDMESPLINACFRYFGGLENAKKVIGLESSKIVWDKKLRAFLKDNQDLSFEELSNKIKKSKGSIKTQKSRMGLRNTKKWNSEYDEVIRNNYKKMNNVEIGKLINKSGDSVQQRIIKLNLKRTPEELFNLMSHKLEEHPNWKNGKSFEPYNKSFNNKFKRAIRKRDNQICMLCSTHKEKLKKALDIHHINYDKLLSLPQNCVSLCHSCHMKTNFNRNHWVKFFQSILSEKYNYNYSDNQEIVMEAII